MLRKRFKSEPLISTMNVTGFVAVMVALVAMFMNPAPTPSGVSVDLPKVRNAVPMPRAKREDALIVAVMRDGRVYFRSDRVKWPAGLTASLRDGLAHGAEHVVYLKVDTRAKYGRVKFVLDCVRSAGLQDIAFFVEQPTAPTPAP